MESPVLLAIGLLLAAFGGYRVARDVVRLRRADRARQSRLRELADNPSTRAPEDPSQVAMQLDQAVEGALREDLTVTGVLLAGLSVAAVFWGRAIGYGEWAVGLYTAGLCGIIAGVALSLVGGVLRLLSRPLSKGVEAPRPAHGARDRVSL